MTAMGAVCLVTGATAHAAQSVSLTTQPIDMKLAEKSLAEKWLVSKTAVRETKDGRFETKVFERFAYPDEFLSVYLGNIVFYRIPKHKGQRDSESVDETVENFEALRHPLVERAHAGKSPRL